jgi:putative transposase
VLSLNTIEVKNSEIQYKAYEFRLKPTEEQKVLLEKHFGCVRFVYNYFLKEKQEHYTKTKKTLNYYICAGNLVKLKRQEFSWLKEVNSQSLQVSLKHLESAYGNFFHKRSKFPKYKSKKSKNSFTIPQHIKIIDSKIYFFKFSEGIRFIKHRKINRKKICYATISKTPTNKYFISVTCEVNQQPLCKTNKSVGIDLGLKDFAITSEGKIYSNPRYFKKYQRKLKTAQQHFVRKIKIQSTNKNNEPIKINSNRREKQRLKVAKIYEKITNSRKDLQHKVSTELIRNYDTICLEDLSIKNMMLNHKLAKSIQDVGWSSFIDKLKYKAKLYGKEIIQIDKFFPSSKMCSKCGWINQNLTLEDRTWTCPSCNTEHNRDINAAKNILSQGINIKSSGSDDHRHGAEISPKLTSVNLGTSVEMFKKKQISAEAY